VAEDIREISGDSEVEKKSDTQTMMDMMGIPSVFGIGRCRLVDRRVLSSEPFRPLVPSRNHLLQPPKEPLLLPLTLTRVQSRSCTRGTRACRNSLGRNFRSEINDMPSGLFRFLRLAVIPEERDGAFT